MTGRHAANGPPLTVYTIGLAGRAFSEIEGRLETWGITTVVDVRSEPGPGEPDAPGLAEDCRVLGLGYVWMGDRLGSRPRHPALFKVDGAPDWEAVARSPGFLAGLGELLRLASQGRVVVLCTEEAPEACHRSFLIASELEEAGAEVLHVVGTRLQRQQPSFDL